MKKVFLNLGMLVAILLVASACEEKAGSDRGIQEESLQFKVSVSDARVPQETTEKKTESDNDIIDPQKLTEFELEFQGIYLKKESGEYVPITSGPFKVNLREFQGTVKELLPVDIEKGTYTAVKTVLSGVSVTYDDNSYKANASGVTVKLNNVEAPITNITDNPFAGEGVVTEVKKSFKMGEGINFRSLRLMFDAEASCRLISVEVPVLGTYEFAGLRPGMGMRALLEEGIQQVWYSPPHNIVVNGLEDVKYSAIHTFKDFHNKGGEITGHTSQHVFRGSDGSLMVDVEPEVEDSGDIENSKIAPVGKTELSVDEIFKFKTFEENLSLIGHTLESGKVYYFSLRKTWKIKTGGEEYTLTRICEPMPVYWP